MHPDRWTVRGSCIFWIYKALRCNFVPSSTIHFLGLCFPWYVSTWKSGLVYNHDRLRHKSVFPYWINKCTLMQLIYLAYRSRLLSNQYFAILDWTFETYFLASKHSLHRLSFEILGDHHPFLKSRPSRTIVAIILEDSKNGLLEKQAKYKMASAFWLHSHSCSSCCISWIVFSIWGKWFQSMLTDFSR